MNKPTRDNSEKAEASDRVERNEHEWLEAYVRAWSPLRRTVAVVSACILALAMYAAVTLAQTFHQYPDEDRILVLAVWARNHNLGPVVTALENLQYQLNPPMTGGVPDLSTLEPAVQASPRMHVHPPIRPVVHPALPGEGRFTDVSGKTGQGGLQITYMRPDKVHTSYLTGIAWMSRNDRFVMHPGYVDPGLIGGWTQPDSVKRDELPGLLATFNSGFQIKDALGGYYDHGAQAGALVPGAASLVIYKDGHATVGAWGADVRLSPNVAFVRQSLKPLISRGIIASDLNTRVESNWGATVGGALAVWRSGLGVTASGDLVYVMGDALSVNALADLLHRAGAINAMQLDINRAWISFMYYQHHGLSVTPKKMGTFQDSVGRYLKSANRDFIAVYAPAGGTTATPTR